MADRDTLGFLGWMLASVTGLVMLTAVVVVHAHAEGWLSLEKAQVTASIASTQQN
jgi:hypothetical protein